MDSILNIEVSCFANYGTPDNPITISLLDWLTSDAYRPEIEQLRQLTNKQQRDEIKATLPAITPSAVCSYRKESAVLQHSGFIQFDVDFKDNQHIINYAELKQQIGHIKNVAYCGLSASGTGYWGLIPIAYPEKHKQHFEKIKKHFASLGISLDEAPKNVVSLRGYSYDSDAYFNHQAVPLQRYERPPKPPKTTYTANLTDDQEKVEACLSEIEARKIDLTCGYNEWFSIGCSFAGTFGEQGRGYFHRVSQFHPDYSPAKTDKQYKHCLTSGSGSIAVFLSRCANAGILYKQAENIYAKRLYDLPTKLTKVPEPVENLIKPDIQETVPPVEPEPTPVTSQRQPEPKPEPLKEVKKGEGNEAGPTVESLTKLTIPESLPKAEKPYIFDYLKEPVTLWNIDELEIFFAGIPLPAEPIKLTQGSIIANLPLFLKSHLAIVKANNGKRGFLPYLERLQQLRQVLEVSATSTTGQQDKPPI